MMCSCVKKVFCKYLFLKNPSFRIQTVTTKIRKTEFLSLNCIELHVIPSVLYVYLNMVCSDGGDDVIPMPEPQLLSRGDEIKAVEQEAQVQSPEDVFIAFARVFSGTIKRGQELYVLGPKHEPQSALEKVQTGHTVILNTTSVNLSVETGVVGELLLSFLSLDSHKLLFYIMVISSRSLLNSLL